MHRHRFLSQVSTEPQWYRIPRQTTPAVEPSSFMAMAALPCACQSGVQQWLYQTAYEQARAVAAPSILARDVLGCWN